MATFPLDCKIERIDGHEIAEVGVNILIEEIALLRIDAVRYGDWTNAEIVMRSGFRTTLYARWLALEELRLRMTHLPELQRLRPAIDEANQCWCGKPTHHKTWCADHAPRCRSGAHFLGNCLCVGTGYRSKSE